jgi:hypothetical protein
VRLMKSANPMMRPRRAHQRSRPSLSACLRTHVMRWSDSLGHHDPTRVADAPLLGDERGALHRIIHGLDVWLLCARRRGSSGGGGRRSVIIFYRASGKRVAAP